MAVSEKSAALDTIDSFSEVVDEVCEQLLDRQIKYTIRRIGEMGNRLARLEQELDDFLGKSNITPKSRPLE